MDESFDWLETSDETDEQMMEAFQFFLALADPSDVIELCANPNQENFEAVVKHYVFLFAFVAAGAYAASTLSTVQTLARTDPRLYTAVFSWAKSAFTRALYNGVTSPVGQTAILVAAQVYMVSELGKTMTGNIGMQTVPSVPGAVTHPFEGGSDEIYYPGKGIVDWFTEKF